MSTKTQIPTMDSNQTDVGLNPIVRDDITMFRTEESLKSHPFDIGSLFEECTVSRVNGLFGSTAYDRCVKYAFRKARRLRTKYIYLKIENMSKCGEFHPVFGGADQKVDNFLDADYVQVRLQFYR